MTYDGYDGYSRVFYEVYWNAWEFWNNIEVCDQMKTDLHVKGIAKKNWNLAALARNQHMSDDNDLYCLRLPVGRNILF